MQSERQRVGIACPDSGHGRLDDPGHGRPDGPAHGRPDGGEPAATYEYDADRAVIEQAKGMLMFVYGIDADEAFSRLREQSQQHNVKLRLIARQVSADLVALARTSSPQRRMQHDLLLRTAHQRIADAASRHTGSEAELGGHLA